MSAIGPGSEQGGAWPRWRRPEALGLALFVLLALPMTWFISATLKILDLSSGALGGAELRLFSSTTFYVAVMGWQPLLALFVVRRFVEHSPMDLGLRRARGSHTTMAALGALALAVVAGGVTLALGSVLAKHMVTDHARVAALPAVPPALGAVLVTLAFAATLLLIWAQAFVEELCWRGYVLTRAMERFGPWRGLFLQGALWGAWYAPVVFFAAYGSLSGPMALVRMLGALVSCALLGALLGWLRLATGSLVPPIVANSVLTFVAGAPHLLFGGALEARAAVLGPVGWALSAVILLLLWRSPLRGAVRVPTATPARLTPTRSATLH